MVTKNKCRITVLFLGLFFCFVSIPKVAKCQQISLKEGAELDVGVGTDIRYIAGEDEKAFYIFRSNREYTKTFIDKINKQSLKDEYSVDLKIRENGLFWPDWGGNILKFNIIGGEVVAVFDVYDKKDNKDKLYSEKISASGTLSEKIELFFTESDSKDWASMFSYDCVFSNDKTKLLFQVRLTPKNSPEQCQMALYECQSMKKIWAKKSPVIINSEGRPGSFYIDSILNDGTASIRWYKEGKDYKGIVKSDESKVVSESKCVEMKEDNENIVLSGKKIITKSGKIIYAGIYYKKINPNDLPNKKTFVLYSGETTAKLRVGSFMAIIDGNGSEAKDATYAPFPSDVNANLKDCLLNIYDGVTMEERSVESIEVQQIIEMKDANYVVSDVAYYSSTDYSNKAGAHKNNYELIVSKFDATGKFEWTKVIPRYIQDAGNYNFLDYHNKLLFFYAEDPKNENIDINSASREDLAQAKLNTANMVCTSIDANGNLTKQVVASTQEGNYKYCPNWIGLKNSDGNLIIQYLWGAKQAKFVSVEVSGD